MESKRPHIVVLGAGFGGLTFCQSFDDPNVEVTLIDRQNHHLFQPLLYQVATAGLSATDIAQPIRSILTDRPHVTVLMDDILDVRLKENSVVCRKADLHYDYLVMALGGVTTYFGHPEWEEFAPGLKSLDDALRIRREILLAFEKAENENDPLIRQQLLTMVVIGGGPTGVELAGAFAELAHQVLASDFRRIDPTETRILLIEASDRVLSHLPLHLGLSAQEQLQKLHVDVRVKSRVQNLSRHRVELDSGEIILAENIIWAAGVGASPITKKLGVETDRAGRLKVLPDLSLPGFPNVFAVGDMVTLVDANGVLVPGVSPAAMQMAKHVANQIEDEITFAQSVKRRPFKYWDKGTMATIGRSAAVAKMKDLEFTGFLAWLAWLAVHLLFLIGFRNKVSVIISWVYSYFTYKRGARIISGRASEPLAPRA